jgi:hypothetical protein
MSSATQARSALSWEDSLQLPATPATLEMLFAGQIAGLCVPDFLTAEECTELKQRAGQYEFENYLNVVPRIGLQRCRPTGALVWLRNRS